MIHPITERQLAICRMIADGWQNKEIAQHEQKSLRSIKRQIEDIMAKTNSSNRASVAAWYVRQVRS